MNGKQSVFCSAGTEFLGIMSYNSRPRASERLQARQLKLRGWGSTPGSDIRLVRSPSLCSDLGLTHSFVPDRQMGRLAGYAAATHLHISAVLSGAFISTPICLSIQTHSVPEAAKHMMEKSADRLASGDLLLNRPQHGV